MAISRVSYCVVAMFALIFAIVLPSVQAHSLAPAPAPTSDDLLLYITSSVISILTM
ncbi:hypothetical protein CsSME_00045150 [Camellia sinensis var. sinensis]